jgi:hypothetical protein
MNLIKYYMGIGVMISVTLSYTSPVNAVESLNAGAML